MNLIEGISRLSFILAIFALSVFGNPLWATNGTLAEHQSGNGIEKPDVVTKAPTMTYATADRKDLTLPIVTTLKEFQGGEGFAFQTATFPPSNDFLMELYYAANKLFLLPDDTPKHVGVRFVMPEVPEGEKCPAVVWIAGSYGITAEEMRFADLIAKEVKAAVAVIDSDRSLGFASVEDKQLSTSILRLVYEAYKVLALLDTHPKIDIKRVMVYGSSKGGLAAELCAHQELKDTFNARHRFVAHAGVSTLPLVQLPDERLSNGLVKDAPLYFYHGYSDDWNETQQMENYFRRLAKVKHPAILKLFPGGHCVEKDFVGKGARENVVNLSNACMVAHSPLVDFLDPNPAKDTLKDEKKTQEFFGRMLGFTPLRGQPYAGDEKAEKLNWLELGREMRNIRKGATIEPSEVGRQMFYKEIIQDMKYLLGVEKPLKF